MGLKEITVTNPADKANKRVPSTLAEYRRKQLAEHEPVPHWRTIDLTQFVAPSIQGAQDQLNGFLDKVTAILQFAREVMELVEKLVTAASNALVTVIEAIRKLIQELLDLITLSDVGIYALYIPFQKGGTGYYVKTFTESLADKKDSHRPQIADTDMAYALFLQSGFPKFKFDGIDQKLKLLATKFFGIVDRLENNLGLPVPEDFVVECVMMPAFRTEGETTYQSREKKAPVAIAASGIADVANKYIQSVGESVSSFATSTLSLAGQPQMTANLTWKTPAKFSVTLSDTSYGKVFGDVIREGENRGSQKRLYTKASYKIRHVYIVRAKDNYSTLQDTALVNKLITSIAASDTDRAEDSARGLLVRKITAFPFRDFYHDTELDPPSVDPLTGSTKYTAYYYRICYGCSLSTAERAETFVGDLNTEQDYLTGENKYSLDSPTLARVEQRTIDGTEMEVYSQGSAVTNYKSDEYYGRSIPEFNGEDAIGDLTRTEQTINNALPYGSSGTPPDWMAYRAFSELIPPLEAYVQMLKRTVDNIADSLIGTSKAIMDVINKNIREIEDLIATMQELVNLLRGVLMPPIVGCGALVVKSKLGIRGVTDQFKNSLALAGPPTDSSFGSQYLKLDPATGKSVSTNDKTTTGQIKPRYDLVPYFPENHYCGGMVFVFGSLPAWKCFQSFLGDFEKYAEGTWIDAKNAGALGFNNIKIPELALKVPRERRLDAAIRAAGELLSGKGKRENSKEDNAAVQDSAETAQGLDPSGGSTRNSDGREEVIGTGKEPFNFGTDRTGSLVIDGKRVTALLPQSNASAALVAAALNAAAKKKIAYAYAGSLQLLSPAGGTLQIGYGAAFDVLGLKKGRLLVSVDAGEYNTYGRGIFTYRPGDLLAEVVGENGIQSPQSITVPAKYRGALAFDDTDTQGLSASVRHLKIEVDTLGTQTIDVTPDNGAHTKLTGATLVGEAAVAFPLDMTPIPTAGVAYNKFQIKVVNSQGLYPTGWVTVSLSKATLGIDGLLSVLKAGLHTAGFTFGTVDIVQDASGGLKFTLTHEKCADATLYFSDAATADTALPILNIASGAVSTLIGGVPTLLGGDLGAGPYSLGNLPGAPIRRNKFKLQIIGAVDGLGIPVGGKLIELPEILYPDMNSLCNQIMLSLHDIGYTLGTIRVDDKSGHLQFWLKKESIQGSTVSLRLDPAPTESCFGGLGFSVGVEATGTDLQLYTAAEVCAQLNARLGALDARYNSTFSINTLGKLVAVGQVKGVDGLIRIVSESADNLESSLVCECLFGVAGNRGFNITVNGIGIPSEAQNFEIEVVGDPRDLLCTLEDDSLICEEVDSSALICELVDGAELTCELAA